jgi:hypothetical protein
MMPAQRAISNSADGRRAAAEVHAAYMAALGWAYAKVVSADEFLAR